MSKLIIPFLLCLSFHIYGQSKVEYTGDGLYFVFISPETNKTVSKVPEGKDVQLTYDTFFKTWNINYSDKNGQRQYSSFSYLSPGPIDSSSCVVMDSYKSKYTMYNYINEKQSIFIISHEYSANYILSINVEGIKLK